MSTPTTAPRVAYLNTRYPCLSHTFIEREVRALRELGWTVVTFTVRPPQPRDRIGAAHEAAAHTTTVLMRSWASLLAGLATDVFRRPGALWRGMARAWMLSPGGRSRPIKALAAAGEALRLVRNLNAADIRHVHVHMANNGAVVASAATAIDPRLTFSVSLHGASDFGQMTDGRLGRKISNASFVRCITSYCKAQAMWATSPEMWARLHTVHCGVFVGPRPVPRGARVGRVRLVSVGRLTSVKAHALLIEACRMLTTRGIDWELAIVGDGELRANLERKVAQHHLEQRVRFCGPVGQEHLAAIYEASDVLVVSSFMEGLPVVLMEAMERGVACVATRVAGIPELVHEGVTGFLATPGDAASLADAIARAVRASPAVLAAARARIERDFEIRGNAAELAKLMRRWAAPVTEVSAVQPEGVPRLS